MVPAGSSLQTFFPAPAETEQCEAAWTPTVNIQQREISKHQPQQEPQCWLSGDWKVWSYFIDNLEYKFSKQSKVILVNWTEPIYFITSSYRTPHVHTPL